MSEEETYEGHSELGFSLATKDAIEDYERKKGKPDKRTRLRVVDMFVDFENPVRDYIVILGPSG